MIIYGKNPVFEAMKLGLVREVFIRKGTALYDVEFKAPVRILQKPEFDGRFHREAQGLAAEIEDREPLAFTEALEDIADAGKVLVLDRIQDPHNFGAIIRSAHVFGIRHILVPRYQQAPVTPAVAKASAGAVFYCTVLEHTNLRDALLKLKEKGFQVAALDMDGETLLSSTGFGPKVALVVGSEGRGLRPSLAQEADLLLRIPMKGEIDSLNAAQSAAIALYAIFG